MDVVDTVLKAARDRSDSVDSRHVLSGSSFSQILYDSLILLFLAGRSGAGKSYLLLQAVEYCAKSDWVVVYIPRGAFLSS